MKILDTSIAVEIEPLNKPFGFKGGYLSELWQTVVKVKGRDHEGIGVGVQSVLWADENIFGGFSERDGNMYMYRVSEYALSLLRGSEFSSPAEATLSIFDKVYEYARELTNKKDLRKTFALNALVAVDNALWQLYSKEMGEEDITLLVDPETRNNISGKQELMYSIPLIGYKTPLEEIRSAALNGSFFMKIKIGSNPNGDGDLDSMLEWDKARLTEVHDILKDIPTPYTDSGKCVYYLDANGRYDTKDRLFRLLDHADKIGALESIVILEEPFSEENHTDVSDIPTLVTADESAYSLETTVRRIEQGYRALALKPIAKTVSESLMIINEAVKRDVHCFCADLTVNPYMVDINKNVAARISRFPGIKIGVFESNGAQNYKNWEEMKTYHPLWGKAKLNEPIRGVCELSDEFYKISGGIYRDSEHYKKIVR